MTALLEHRSHVAGSGRHRTGGRPLVPVTTSKHGQAKHRRARLVPLRAALVYGPPVIALIVEALTLTHRANLPVPTGASSPRSQAQAFTAASVPVCAAQVAVLLRQDLQGIATGLSPVADPSRTLAARYGPGSAVLVRIDLAHQRLLRTAGSDFLGRFDRDVDAELRAYRLRLTGACATP